MNASRYDFSAKVDMELMTSHGKVDVRQCGGDLLIARHPIDIPPGEAVFTLSIDGEPDRMRVYLPDGIMAGEEEHRMIAIETRDQWLARREAERQRLLREPPQVPAFVNRQLA